MANANAQPAGRAILRPHQVNMLGQVYRLIKVGERRIIGQAATGFGKTVVAARIAQDVLNAGKRMIFTVPAVSLIDQTVEKFYAAGIYDIGVIQANHPLTNYSRSVQIASVQTLMRRGD
jgi:DNA repair protein RadD